MKSKFNKLKVKMIDYLEEILVVIATISFIIFGFLVSVKIGFLTITIGLLFLGVLTVRYKRLLNKE